MLTIRRTFSGVWGLRGSTPGALLCSAALPLVAAVVVAVVVFAELVGC